MAFLFIYHYPNQINKRHNSIKINFVQIYLTYLSSITMIFVSEIEVQVRILRNIYKMDDNYLQEPNFKTHIKIQDQQTELLSSPNLQKRMEGNIEVSKYKEDAYLRANEGHKSQTHDLNINVKTLTKKFLKQKLKLKELGQEEKSILINYCLHNPSFKSRNQLFGIGQKNIQTEAHINIQQSCFQYYGSTKFVKDIMLSDRMYLSNKILTIKYLKKIQRGVVSANSKWKTSSMHDLINQY